MNPEQRLTPKEAAKLSAKSVDTIRRAYRSGELPACRRGGILIRWADLEEWLKADPVQPHARRRPEPARRRVAAPPERGSLAALEAIEARRAAS